MENKSLKRLSLSKSRGMTRIMGKLSMLMLGALLVLVFENFYIGFDFQNMGTVHAPKVDTISEKEPSKCIIKENNQITRKRKGTTVYRFDGQEFERLYDFCTWSVPLSCVTLKTPAGPTPIHIHDISVDIWVSGSLKKNGAWEGQNVNLVLAELRKDPNLGFLDLGSHVGTFSISVAKFGRKVVSVDPLIENVQRLCKSAEKGGLADNVTIVFNPLADEHTMVNFNREFNNVGGTSVVKNKKISQVNPCDDSADSPTAMLDDLIPLLPFSKAVVKMDVQGYEYIILKSAKTFFNRINVSAILMEWDMLKKSKDGQLIANLLNGYGFKAYTPTANATLLDSKDYTKWPYDVMWRRAQF